ncbi:hypothetical protein [Aromatoleum aromaticum]|uniref:hypothetical protein n=1 Tax=Aromatoleum aromaticum TaxID=551760 RepID=UPI0002E4FECE|nr:hypothetical protein [Aromatoleum aromaticum]
MRVLHYDGTPITARFIAGCIGEALAERGESAIGTPALSLRKVGDRVSWQLPRRLMLGNSPCAFRMRIPNPRNR